MSGQVEWLEPDGGDPGDHSIEDHRRPAHGGRSGRWRRAASSVPLPVRLGAALVALVAVVLAVALSGSGRHDRPAALPSSSAAEVVGTVSDEQSAVSNLVALAATSGPAVDYVRATSAAGSCTTVRPGHAPGPAIARAVHAALPEFTLSTARRTLDQFTGLCSIGLRSARVRGTVLVLSVAAPSGALQHPTYDRVRTGVETRGATTTRYVVAELRTGWTVMLGTIGNVDSMPSSQELLALAQEPALIW